MEKIVIGIIFSVIVYLVIGAVVCIVVDNYSLECFDEEEMVAIFIFYPIIGLAIGTLGIIKMAIRVINSLKESIDELLEDDNEM